MNPTAGKRAKILRCSCPLCGLRIPAVDAEKAPRICPLCRARMDVVLESPPEEGPSPIQIPSSSQRGPHIEALLDNIRSAFNVGSIFRTADGAGIRHVHLCGITPTPHHPKISKTALGAEKSVPWSHHPDGLAAVEELLDREACLWALEWGLGSEPLFGIASVPVDRPLILVVGNEVSGVDPAILKRCQRLLHIPMLGSKRSLNVAVAFGIAAYALRFSPFSTEPPDAPGSP